MTLRTLAAALAVAAPLSAAAQDGSGDRDALAKALVATPVTQAQLDAVADTSPFEGAFAEMGMPPEAVRAALEIFEEELVAVRGEIEREMERSFAENFSAAELAYLGEVYSDPRLAEMSDSFAAFYSSFSTAMQPALADASARAMERLMPLMRQGGGGMGQQ